MNPLVSNGQFISARKPLPGRRGGLWALIASFCIIAFAEATTINPLNQSDPSGFTVSNSTNNWGRGWKFTVNVDDLYVTELGLNTPEDTGQFSIVLWDFATQTALASVAGQSGGPAWNFVPISPIALVNGSSYVVELYAGTSGSRAFYFADSLGPEWYPTGDITYNTMQFCNSCGAATFPTLTLDGFHFGVVDIGYQVGEPVNTIPEPSTFVLLGIGLLGLCGYSRKKN